MKKLFSLILLVFIFNNACSNEGKDFYFEFLKAIHKENMINNLSEQCFGNFFDYYSKIFKISYIQGDIVTLVTSMENIFIDSFLLNCPSESIKEIFGDIDFNVTQKEFTTMFVQRFLTFSKIVLNEISNKHRTGASLGKTAGEIFFLFSKNYTDAKKEEKSPQKPFDINNYFELIEGIFLGMKKDNDTEESLCYKDVMKGKDEIIKQVKKGMKGVEQGKGFWRAVKTIIFNLMVVEGLVVDCNLLTLGGTVIFKLSNDKERQILFDNFLKNIESYYNVIKHIFEGLINDNLKEIGIGIGKFISKLFEFNVK